MTSGRKSSLLLVHTNVKIPVRLTKSFIHACQAACNKFPTIEWSGICFYKLLNSETIQTLNIEVFDFLPLSADTAAHTGFTYDATYLQYLIEKGEDPMTVQLGDIHSHNKMDVFFSSTDNQDLADNTQYYDYFLSIVCNNAGQFCIKLSVPASTSYEVKHPTGTTEKLTSSNQALIFDCNVILPDGYKADDIFMSWLGKVQVKQPVSNMYPTGGTYNGGHTYGSQGSFDFGEDKYLANRNYTKPNKIVKKSVPIDNFIKEYIFEDYSSKSIEQLMMEYQHQFPIELVNFEDFVDETGITNQELCSYIQRSITAIVPYKSKNQNLEELIPNLNRLIRELNQLKNNEYKQI